MRYPLVQTRNVLVTGCSTGIGAAAAAVLRGRGWTAVPTARRDEDLQRLCDSGFSPLRLDMTESDSVVSAVDAFLRLVDGLPGAVVNNAGFGQAGAIEDLSRDAMRRQFEVNVFGMQELTNRLIPHFRRQGYGRIVNISSVLGRISLPFNAMYSASKYAMEAMSDGLRIELDGSGIAVSLVEPGPILTAFGKNASENAQRTLDVASSHFGTRYRRILERRKDRPPPPRRFVLPPEAVALKIAHALESPRPRIRYCVTLPAYAGALVRRFSPDGFTDWMLRRSARKKGRQGEA